MFDSALRQGLRLNLLYDIIVHVSPRTNEVTSCEQTVWTCSDRALRPGKKKRGGGEGAFWLFLISKNSQAQMRVTKGKSQLSGQKVVSVNSHPDWPWLLKQLDEAAFYSLPHLVYSWWCLQPARSLFHIHPNQTGTYTLRRFRSKTWTKSGSTAPTAGSLSILNGRTCWLCPSSWRSVQAAQQCGSLLAPAVAVSELLSAARDTKKPELLTCDAKVDAHYFKIHPCKLSQDVDRQCNSSHQ